MAVRLVRNEEAEIIDDNSTLPIIEIKSKGVSAPKCFEGKITSRTNTVFTSDSQQRDDVWQNNFIRRQSQKIEGGFHSTPGHKYTEIGDVVLDDGMLILQALDQDSRRHYHTDIHEEKTTGSLRSLPPPLLRSRTLSQFPDPLRSLHMELSRSDAHLSKIRKGKGLFHLIRQDEEQARLKIDMAAKMDKEENHLEWKEAETNSDSIHDLVVSTEDNDEPDDNSDDSEIEHTLRFLRVILWVLECMKLESPHYMPALGTYWRISRPQCINGKRIYERQQALLNKWEELIGRKQIQIEQESGKKESKPTTSSAEKHRIQIEKLRKQNHLTPEQFEKLKVIVDEELNRSKKKARLKIKELMEESAQKYRRRKISEKKMMKATVRLDVDELKTRFEKVDESCGMVIHEQLSVMSRDRQDALEQRFSSFSVTDGLWKDIADMRSGVEIETTAMAHNKLRMNYDWISDLKQILPDVVLTNRYSNNTLDQLHNLQEYMNSVGPTVMSQEKLVQALSTLYPWQLESPEVTKAIEFIIKNVIYIVPDDYQKWAEHNSIRRK